jgi:hypothetical protein
VALGDRPGRDDVAEHRPPEGQHGRAEGANNLADRVVTVTEQRWHGPARVQRPVVRTGGRWLALVSSGYKIRLNNGDEALAVLEAAQPDDDAAA